MNQQCPKCGSDMYDNRGTKTNPRQPDFKCKRYKEGCDGVIWPPKGGIKKTLVTQNKPVEDRTTKEQPDWDNIALGKCRTLFLVEAFKAGKTLSLGLINECNEWAQACVDGTVSEDNPEF